MRRGGQQDCIPLATGAMRHARAITVDRQVVAGVHVTFLTGDLPAPRAHAAPLTPRHGIKTCGWRRIETQT
jgi:hypothetical protein